MKQKTRYEIKNPVIVGKLVIDVGDTLELVEEPEEEIVEYLGSYLFLVKKPFKLNEQICLERGDKFRIWPNKEKR